MGWIIVIVLVVLLVISWKLVTDVRKRALELKVFEALGKGPQSPGSLLAGPKLDRLDTGELLRDWEKKGYVIKLDASPARDSDDWYEMPAEKRWELSPKFLLD